MSWQYDYWYVENYYSAKERKKISEYIENNHTGIEKLDAVATDKNNVSKKKANTLLIKYGKVKNIGLVQWDWGIFPRSRLNGLL